MLHLYTCVYGKNTEVQLALTNFPAGETGVRLVNPPAAPDGVSISAVISLKFEGNDDLINLLLLTDAIRKHYIDNPIRISLDISYFPYARQDRVCNTGEALSAKVIADLINAQKYACVYIVDSHSDVVPALLDRCYHYKLNDAAAALSQHLDMQGTVLVSPDAGANKKVFALAKAMECPEVIRADKIRDLATGAIKETRVFSEHLGSMNVLVVDDICDGGRTFVELGKKLKEITDGEIYLYVTHGIFTQGFEELRKYFKNIFVFNAMLDTKLLPEFVVQL